MFSNYSDNVRFGGYVFSEQRMHLLPHNSYCDAVALFMKCCSSHMYKTSEKTPMLKSHTLNFRRLACYLKITQWRDTMQKKRQWSFLYLNCFYLHQSSHTAPSLPDIEGKIVFFTPHTTHNSSHPSSRLILQSFNSVVTSTHFCMAIHS